MSAAVIETHDDEPTWEELEILLRDSEVGERILIAWADREDAPAAAARNPTVTWTGTVVGPLCPRVNSLVVMKIWRNFGGREDRTSPKHSTRIQISGCVADLSFRPPV
jgi:hypothetical protein